MPLRRSRLLLAATVLVAGTAAAAALGASSASAEPAFASAPEYAPVRGGAEVRPATAQSPSSTATVAGAGIDYHGGPVMVAPTTTVHLIWYGNWTGTSATQKQTIITTFLKSLTGSPYWNINTTYTNGAKVAVRNSVTLGGQATDTGSAGTANLSDNAILTIVARALSTNALPKSTDALYVVLTAPNVTKQGFLTSYCGWHTHALINSADIKLSFVGDPTGSLIGNCAAQTTISPNGSPAADAMVSLIAHELAETVTDPALNAWFDKQGAENADKCAWTFGSVYKAPNGSAANVKLGTKDYLVQQNWVNAGTGKCGLRYP